MDLLKRYAQPVILLVGYIAVVVGLSAVGYQLAEHHTQVSGWFVASIIAGTLLFSTAIWVPSHVEVER